MDIKRVLLIYPFAVQAEYSLDVVRKRGQFCQAPIGLAHIASYVRAHASDIEIEVFDANAMAIEHILETDVVDMDELWSMLAERVADFAPDVIGVSSLFHEIAGIAHRTMAAARQAAPVSIGVMGGNYPEASPQIALADENVEFVVLSEGELAFTHLLDCLRKGTDPAIAVDGLVCRIDALDRVRRIFSESDKGPDGLVDLAHPLAGFEFDGLPNATPLHRSPKTNYPESLDDYPWPDRSGFNMELYATYSRSMIQHDTGPEEFRVAHMTASRGCPFKCTFCSSKNFWGAQIRYRDHVDVVREMKHLHEEYGINYYVFNDDNIMFHRKWLLDFCNEILRQNLNIRWMSGGGIQASSMKPDVVEALHASGVRIFQMSLETGKAETLRRIMKPLSGRDGQADEIIALIRKYEGVWISSNFVSGFYFETIDDILENHAYGGSLDLDWRNFFSFIPLPGAEDFESCVEHGYISGEQIWADGVVGRLRNLNTENFTAEKVSHLNYAANLRYNFLENRNLSLDPLRAIRDFDYVIKFVPDHAIAYFARGIAERNAGRSAASRDSLREAAKIVSDTADLPSLYGGDKGAPSRVRWKDFFDEFGVDADAEFRAELMVGQR